MRRRPSAVFLLPMFMVSVVAVVTHPTIAHSEPERSFKAEARTRVQEGAALFDAGDFAGALARFDQAFALFPSPSIHFNRAQALRALGRRTEAVAALNRFLEDAVDAPVEKLREAQEQLQELDPSVTPAPTPQPVGRPMAMPDPARRLQITREPPESAKTGHQSGGHRTLGMVIGAVGLLGLCIGTVYGVQELSANSQAMNLCPGDICASKDVFDSRNRHVAEAMRDETRSIVAFVVGGAAVLVGATLVLTAPSRTSHAKKVLRVTALAAAGLTGVGLTGDW